MMTASSPQVGPFRLLKLRGSGGMGQVFEAVNDHTGQRVALKLLSPAMSREPQVVARFLQEGRALVGLDLPDVVRVFHCERQADQVFLVMELLEGMSLREWMARHTGPVPREAALALCAQVARAMARVHTEGIVHRDLKPENVFLCPDASVAPGFRIKLLDFGIAKLPPVVDGALAATQVHTHEAALIGTYFYTAPEQLRSASTVNGAADVYSLGVMLFELLAGQRPFVSDDVVDVITAHMSVEAPLLGQCVPSIPGALSTFVASMLAKSPTERPSMARCRDMLGRPWEQEQDTCPVPGLAPFSEAQAELFFGRKEETGVVLRLLDEARSGGRRWIQLEGPSGVGKSSLLQAGVLPRLVEPPPPELPRWSVATVRPSYEPVRSLAKALVVVFPALDVEGLERRLREGPAALGMLVQEQVPEGTLLLLVVEPLEELFTSGAAERFVLDALLAHALGAEDGRLRLLTGLRSDFLHRLEQLPKLSRLLHGAARYPLLPMEEAALEEVIQGMARHAGLRLSEGLSTRMVRDARGEGGGLPLLGHALRSLWAMSGGAPLTHEHYVRMGGVGGALSQQAEQLLAELGEDGRERAKGLLLALVQVGRGAQDTRRPRSRREVLSEAGGDKLAEDVLLRLSGLSGEAEQGPRLVLLSGGPEVEAQRVDLVHETLLQRVPSLVTWLDEERRHLEIRADLEVAARTWDEAKRPSDGLPLGTLLTHYREGLAAPGRGVSARAETFLQAASRLEQRQGWTRRALVFAASLAMCVILFAAVRADQERRRADEHRRVLINAVDNFVRSVDWELSWLPNTLAIRRPLLDEFDQLLRQLPDEEQQRHEVLMANVGMAHRLGDVEFLNGTLREAGARLERARELLRLGKELGIADDELRMQWAFNHSKQGKVAMAAGRLPEARARLLQSIEFFEAQRAVTKESISGNRASAVSQAELAELELEEGRMDEAIRLFDRALPLFSKEDPDYRATLHAHALAQQAEAMRRAGRQEEARPRLDEAVRLAQLEVDGKSGDQHRKWALGWVRLWNARLAVDQGRQVDAEANYTQARTLGQELLGGEPSSKRFARVLAEALLGLEQRVRRRGEALNAEALRGERCALVQEFLKNDAEDVRFKALACEGSGP
ncbi:serine/threonine-protein kinase [Myxococcus sp. CA033]|uniref:serine/threonine-protein kinase n=1 Tax=Myxococcus sp. CA033 TaxID=2741516 RepID=UPI0020C6C645|nr:serine/threonine-protein kinase [Myxococcus sp. CA033]